MELVKVICFCLFFFKPGLALKFVNINSEIFPVGAENGVIAAFGHFNSDEYTDVVTLQSGFKKLQLLRGSEDQPYFKTSTNCSYGNVISSVVPSDFNGDSLMDMLITLDVEKLYEVRIIWGSNGSVNCYSDSLLVLASQPIIVDFNGDMLPDIIGEIPVDQDHTKRFVWLSSRDKSFQNRTLTGKHHQKFKIPHSSGLIDLTNNMVPDILITGTDHIEVWYNTGSGFELNETDKIPYPHRESSNMWIFQSTFVDINLDGRIDHILPVCYDRKCAESKILIWNTNTSIWEELFGYFYNPNDKSMWGFKFRSETMFETPVTLRAGDVDMDGFPDLIVILQSKSKTTDFQAMILKNVHCENCAFGRTFDIQWNVPGLNDLQNVEIAAFFDLFEDGNLDILTSTYTKGEWKMQALKNTEVLDSCFLKVLVLNGLCNHNCSYGVNQPGPVVRYNMTTQEGYPLVSTSIQLSQSAHFPLQLPYSLFGLGPTPNFIDLLTVSIPSSFNNSVHKREWVQIIPNSQIVVIPHPPDNEQKWVKRLFVTPSHLVVLTLISLVGTCIFLSLLVALLQWREKVEDKKEKMQNAYKFHFDAM